MEAARHRLEACRLRFVVPLRVEAQAHAPTLCQPVHLRLRAARPPRQYSRDGSQPGTASSAKQWRKGSKMTKPPSDGGFGSERATGIEPAASSLGSLLCPSGERRERPDISCDCGTRAVPEMTQERPFKPGKRGTVPLVPRRRRRTLSSLRSSSATGERAPWPSEHRWV